MAKIKEILVTLKQLFSQIIRAVIGHDEIDDITNPTTQQNRYYT